jgi:hypothetical protein
MNQLRNNSTKTLNIKKLKNKTLMAFFKSQSSRTFLQRHLDGSATK